MVVPRGEGRTRQEMRRLSTHNKSGATKQARGFRRDAGVSEQVVWSVLRSLRSQIAFKRQVPLGPYVVDFYCARACLVIELDNDFHDAARDQVRDAFLASLGLEVLRLRTDHVFEGGTDWLDQVSDAVQRKTGVRLVLPG